MADHWRLDLSGGVEKAPSGGDTRSLNERDVAPSPFEQFGVWLADAEAAGIPMHHAMVLATASKDGVPSARTVLLERFDPQGFVFHTNLESPKCRELAENPRAALVFLWRTLGRQVRIVGEVVPATPEETAEYFDACPPGVQAMVWACQQSAVVPDRATLEDAFLRAESRLAATPLPVPDFWGGLRLVPWSLEFWQARPNRLQDRLRYVRGGGADAGWSVERLAP